MHQGEKSTLGEPSLAAGGDAASNVIEQFRECTTAKVEIGSETTALILFVIIDVD